MTPRIRRPLLGFALSMVAGLYARHLLGGSPLLFLGLCALALSWVCWMRQHRTATFALYLTCAFLGAATLAIEKSESSLRSVLPTSEVLHHEQDITGRVIDDPVVSDENSTQAYRLRVESVRFGDEWIRADSVVRVYSKNQPQKSAYGERWRIKGRYRSYGSRRGGNDGSFRATDAIHLQEARASFRAACYQMRQRAARILSAGIEAFPEQIKILHALLLGIRSSLPPSLYQTFANTGTLHIFAISGLHVGVLGLILIAGLKIITIPKPKRGVLIIPLLFFYVVSTGMKPSAVRAFTMAAIYFSAPFLNRRSDSVTAVSLAAILLLFINPLQLFEPGFLLSFLVVSGIIMVHGYTRRLIGGYARPIWTIPLTQLSGKHPFRATTKFFVSLIITSIAAWLFSTPLTALFFNTLSPVALAGNLVIIPLTTAIVLSGCLTFLAAPFSFAATVVLNHANCIFVDLLIFAIKTVGTLPGAYQFVRSPSTHVLLIWYAGLILFFTGTTRLRKLAFFLSLGAVLLWLGEAYRPFSGVEIHNIGTTATLLRIEPTLWVLVTDGSPYGKRRTVQAVQKRGINQLHALVVSDSMAEEEAVETLCRTFSPSTVWLPPNIQSKKLEHLGGTLANPRWVTEGGTVGLSLR